MFQMKISDLQNVYAVHGVVVLKQESIWTAGLYVNGGLYGAHMNQYL